MKSIFTFLAIIVFFSAAYSQENADYYRPVFPRPVGVKQFNAGSLLKTLGDVKIINRWYAGASGFIRTDKNRITNSLEGLAATDSPEAYGWSVAAGWVSHEQWAVEAEYARSPIHNVLILNGDNSLSYKFANDKNSLILRGKRRLLFGKPSLRRSAFWLSGGIGLVPNSGKQKDYWEFEGFRGRGRRNGVDTLFITSETRTNTKFTGLAEASAEYIVKISKGIDLAFFGRKQWGLGNSLETNLVYYVNHQETQSAKITGDGSGWNLGISLRYNIHIGYDYAKLNVNSRRDRNPDGL
ncbi:hypothetical protein [Dyadobacter psychrotolerans]|uniref:Uncharacterized protein n=1 Tax=Dyadobacter psychrotolerans TaxID=2541721 RepID=A0A4R5DS35_9BACT|nr:hypothetical protein [Dyadobacter psychrotolerans]TDE16527.1 hypothetical protein E0F88_09830 [Dyadobacter psychrotolerans]